MWCRKWKRILIRLAVFLLILASVLFTLRIKYDKVIVSLAETRVQNATSDLINDAIDLQIAEGNVQYDRIVYFEKDLNGKITALKTNMGEINRLKTTILNIINNEIVEMDTSEIGIPLGSLFLPEMFSGRGPEFPVSVLSIRNSEASFSSDFIAAGINQTLHKINMHISVDITILVLGKTNSFTICSQVVVAETIIIGHVPETLFQTGGSNER